MTTRFDLSHDWFFQRLGSDQPGAGSVRVELPHSPFVADLDGRNHWFGRCEYRRVLEMPAIDEDERCYLHLGAAMQRATVRVNGEIVGDHSGGYLPFALDLTAAARRESGRVEIAVELDNRFDAEIPPGKPFDELDFCWYGGLYRDVWLSIVPAVHITDTLTSNVVAGGGVFIRTISAAPAKAVVSVRTHLRNYSPRAQATRVRVTFRHRGSEIVVATSDALQLAAGSDQHVEQTLTLLEPRLWSPDFPELYDVAVTLLDLDDKLLDRRDERFGVRRIAFSRSGGFVLNDRSLRLRGANRHQDFPHVGYAAPRAAQFRDARRIKEAGFDYVRLSHYPQSPDFLDACDEIGLVAMACIPGWQYIGNERFRAACLENARQLVRRDRNHPSIVLWELSLNETPMDDAFMAQLHAAGHEEFPGDQMFTCGWIDRFDVFSHSRQHSEIHRWQNGDKALVIAEYGDWEFFASNEGFDQKSGAGRFAAWSTARQFRSDGERGLLQQAFNHMIALNDTLSSPAALDGVWVMFDYPRGYDSVRAAAGIMDIFRIPKFSYHFYRSQRDASFTGGSLGGDPEVFIASYWTPTSGLRIPVFSNCDEVELRLNGRTVARQHPAFTALTQHLPHPPFFFDLPEFIAGTLEAVGYLGGKAKAVHRVGTPGSPAQLHLVIDDQNIFAQVDEPDVLFVHAHWHDAAGNLCVSATAPITFSVFGAAEIIGPTSCESEAGIASAVVRLPAGSSGFILRAAPAAGHDIAAVECPWTHTVQLPLALACGNSSAPPLPQQIHGHSQRRKILG